MATYLRRMVVPEADVPKVINDIKTTFGTPAEQIMTSRIKIGSRVFRIIRFVAHKPYLYQAETLTIPRNGLTEAKILKRIYATDLDIQAALYVDASDFSGFDDTAEGTGAVTVNIVDLDGITNSLEFSIAVVDATLAVITLTSTTPDAEAGEAIADTWTPASNIASALDDGDDVSGSVTFTYKKTDADGDALADLAAAQAWLETVGNAVYVEYDYQDAAGNDAVTKTAIFTAVDTVAPVITLIAETANVTETEAATWNEAASNITSAVDDVDGDVSGNVVITYTQDTYGGAALATIGDVQTYLGTPGNVVFVHYSVDDAEGNTGEATLELIGVADA